MVLLLPSVPQHTDGHFFAVNVMVTRVAGAGMDSSYMGVLEVGSAPGRVEESALMRPPDAWVKYVLIGSRLRADRFFSCRASLTHSVEQGFKDDPQLLSAGHHMPTHDTLLPSVMPCAQLERCLPPPFIPHATCIGAGTPL